MNKATLALLTAGMLTLGSVQAQAVPITYTFIAENSSGSIGGSSFSGQTVTLTFSGDTDNVVPAVPGGSSPSNPGGNFNTTSNGGLSGTFSIGNLFSGTTGNVNVIHKNYGTSISTTQTFLSIYSGVGPLDLASDYTQYGDYMVHSANLALNTSLGNLFLTQGRSDEGGTFSSALVQPSEVPEPAAMALLGIGLAGLGASRMRQGQKAKHSH